MGGQDGFSRDLLGYQIDSDAVMAGIHFTPSDGFSLDLDVVRTASDAALDPFALPAPEYVATHPPTIFDFSMSHTYSALDVERIDAQVGARYKFNQSLWINLRYRYADYEDNDPYMYDTSGSFDWISGSLGWRF